MSGGGDDASFGISRHRFLISIAVAVMLVSGAAGVIGDARRGAQVRRLRGRLRRRRGD